LIRLTITFVLFFNFSAFANFYLEDYIFDQHTSSPISVAEINILYSDEQIVTSNASGYFILENIDKAVIDLVISKAGYYTEIVEQIDLINSNNIQLRIALMPNFVELENVVVKAKRIPININKTVVGVQELNKASGAFDDPSRVLQELPSARGTNDQANHISIRGNSPNATKWYLEDLEIINPNHLNNAGIDSDLISTSGGGVLLLSGQVLDNTTFYNSAFPVTYSNSIGGIVNLDLNQGSEQKYNHRFKIGLIGIDIGSKGPIVKSSGKSNYLVNYRYSTLGLLSKMGIDLGDEAINFQDFVFNIEQSLSNKFNLKVYGFWGKSSNVFDNDSIANESTEEKFLYDIVFNSQSVNSGVQLNYNPTGNDLFYAKINYGNQQNKRNKTLKTTGFSNADQLNQQKLSTRLGWHRKFAKGVFKSSLVFINNKDDVSYLVDVPPLNYNYTSFANNIDLQFNSKISANAGLNLIYYNHYKEFLVEPRVRINFQLTNNLLTSLQYGKHSQYPYFRIVNAVTSEKLKTEKAHHYNLNIQYNLNRIRLLTSLYYQQVYDVAIDDGFFSAVNQFSDLVDNNLKSSGKARNYGFEWQAVYKGNNNFGLHLLGSISKSTFNNIKDEWFDSRFDQGFSLVGLISKDFLFSENRVLGFNAKATYAGGLKYTPIDLATSLNSLEIVYNSNEIFGAQYPDFFRADLKLYFQKKKKKRNTEWSIDIQNVTKATNLAYIYLDENQQQLVKKNQLGLVPILNYKIDF